MGRYSIVEKRRSQRWCSSGDWVRFQSVSGAVSMRMPMYRGLGSDGSDGQGVGLKVDGVIWV